jgi:hypothetical protein
MARARSPGVDTVLLPRPCASFCTRHTQSPDSGRRVASPSGCGGRGGMGSVILDRIALAASIIVSCSPHSDDRPPILVEQPYVTPVASTRAVRRRCTRMSAGAIGPECVQRYCLGPPRTVNMRVHRLARVMVSTHRARVVGCLPVMVVDVRKSVVIDRAIPLRLPSKHSPREATFRTTGRPANRSSAAFVLAG